MLTCRKWGSQGRRHPRHQLVCYACCRQRSHLRVHLHSARASCRRRFCSTESFRKAVACLMERDV